MVMMITKMANQTLKFMATMTRSMKTFVIKIKCNDKHGDVNYCGHLDSPDAVESSNWLNRRWRLFITFSLYYDDDDDDGCGGNNEWHRLTLIIMILMMAVLV